MQKSEISKKFFSELQAYLKSAEFGYFQNDNPTVAAQIKDLTQDKLIIGDCPKFSEARFEGNVTGKGHSYTGDTRYERTFCTDFTTGKYTFIADGGLTDEDLCAEALALTDGGHTKAYSAEERNSLLQSEVDAFVKYELRKLDYWFDSARLNSWNLVWDGEPEELPFYPVYVNLDDGNGGTFTTVIGVYSFIGGNEIIKCDIHKRIVSQPINARTSISAIAAAAKAAKKKKISIALGITFALLLIIGTALGSLLPVIL